MFQAECIGASIAHELVNDQKLARFGTTSRGCFLLAPSGWTAFLTEESPRGPLTINLPPESIAAIKAALEEEVPLRDNLLHFSNTVKLNLQAAPRWEPQYPNNHDLQPIEIRRKTTNEAIRYILERKAADGLTGILPDLIPFLALPNLPASITNPLPYTHKLLALINCLRAGSPYSARDHLATFLGQGSGLTPSGDDFLMGFYLTLNRWGKYLLHDREYYPGFGQEIVSVARQKTTHLSASLIACAVQGQADERLILALDNLMTSKSCNPASLEGLLTWGSSSGMDALAGMLTASFFTNTS